MWLKVDKINQKKGIDKMEKWKMIGRYVDNEEIIVGGYCEVDCVEQLIDYQEKHGNLTWYSGFCDEFYDCGEYIGSDDFYDY